jgi:hypothetical protein
MSNKTKLLKSTDQERLRSVALVLEATTTAHDSRTAMLTCAGNLELQLWYCVEYLAVENGLRVEDLSRQACASCVQQSSQPIHTQVLLWSWWDKGRRIAHPMRPRPNLGPGACCIFAVNFGDFVHLPRDIIFVPCNLCICYSPTRDLHAAKSAAIGLLFRWPCLSIPIRKALALFFICIFRSLPSLNLSYLTFSHLPKIYLHFTWFSFMINNGF